MRRELIRAGAVESLNIGLQDMMKSEVQSNVRYVSLATNEYLWALRATVKLVGQEEKSAISEDLEKRGVRHAGGMRHLLGVAHVSWLQVPNA